MQEYTTVKSAVPTEPQGNASAHNRRRSRLLILACAAVAAVTLLASDGFLRGAALVGAGMQFPEGVGALFVAAKTPTAANQEEGTTDAIDAAQGAAQPKTTDTATADKSFDLAATPPDVLALMEQAKAQGEKRKKAGEISEKTYVAKDGTQTLGNVSIRNTTAARKVDIAAEIKKKLPLRIDKSKPAVLIYHTHTTEAYEIVSRAWYPEGWQERTENSAKNVIRVGDAIALVLERSGYIVIHDTTIYDRQYGGAYDRSRVTMQKYLKQYPELMVTIDVHRDAIHADGGVRIKPTATVNGKKAAQVMIITGTEEGNITGYPNWAQNLSFAVQLQKQTEDAFPGLMRPLFFCPRKYNMNETPYSLLLEFGSDANTLEEAVYSGQMIGASLAKWMDQHAT